MSQSEIEEELYKEALRHASSESKHSKNEISSVVIEHLEVCLSRKRLTGVTDSEYDPVFLMWETASSPFCEDTLLFELHVHGFPLDPVRGLFFIQMTMTAIQTILVCYTGHTCWRLRRKTVYTKKQGHKQCKAGDVIVKAARTLHSCFLQLYCIIFRIVLNAMLDHFIMLLVLLDTGTLMAPTFQGITEMFNESDPEHFGSIFRTIFTLLQILSLDNWSLIYMTSRDNGAPHIIYFLSLYFLVELFTFLNLFIAVLVDNFPLSIHKKRQCKSQKSPDVKEGEIQSSEKVEEVLEMSQSEIEEELYKEALRHASSESKHSKRKIELVTRRLQLLAAMEQHMQRYRAQACLLDNLVETFFTLGVRVSSNLETKCSHAVHPPSKENEHDMGRRDECCTLQGKIVQKLESAAVNEEVDMVGISSSAPSTGTLTPTMEEVPLPPSVRSRDDESIVCCFP
ncbi:hypothetical protein AOLI_G00323850 [Acnodon oligacanthus]